MTRDEHLTTEGTMSESCFVCEMGGVPGVRAALKYRGLFGSVLGICRVCALRGGFYRVVAILPDGQIRSDEEHVGPRGRELMDPSSAEVVAAELALDVPEGHEGVTYEARELSRDEIQRLLDAAEAER